MKLPYITPTETPIYDRLMNVTGGQRLATWNRDRGRLAWGADRKIGGEWDLIRALPLKVRRQLTGAGFMAKHGSEPDVFVHDIKARVPGGVEMSDNDIIAWFIREARRAIPERRNAHMRDVKRGIAKRAGVRNYYEYRCQQARAAGFDSFWAYRQHRKWEE